MKLRDFAVYSFLVSRKDSVDECWYSVEHIAEYCNISINTARRALHWLEENGYIEIKKSFLGGVQQTNLYKVHRIAEGETKNCQDIMAMEKYRQKTEENPAIKIYNKYYKRYAARVKVHTILEDDFKKWKYQVVTKRDECMDGKITENEFIKWMEGCFPNRNRKHYYYG